jgi:8-oxo-dGTP pyrophosphatase MutT (NUDIX family)
MRSPAEAIQLVSGFAALPIEEKSRELILALLQQTPAPFSREQFQPGHITCTALVFHPDGQQALFIYHHRHQRWLLPGGHVEESDLTLGEAARREAIEETAVQIAAGSVQRLAGMDVHGIPARKAAPFHLHHDLIFAMAARSSLVMCTQEAPKIAWLGVENIAQHGVPPSILIAFNRAKSGSTHTDAMTTF